MASYTAKDVSTLRQMTGAGILDCRNALEETGGDIEEAAKLLREKGLAGAAKRSDREASEGAVAVARSGDAAAVVELRCETDFVAKADEFVALTDELAALVAAKGEDAAASSTTPSTACARRSRRTSPSGGCAAWWPSPARSSTPTCTCRPAAASTPWPS